MLMRINYSDKSFLDNKKGHEYDAEKRLFVLGYHPSNFQLAFVGYFCHPKVYFSKEKIKQKRYFHYSTLSTLSFYKRNCSIKSTV